MQRNPFAVLRIPPEADLETARAEYRALARKHHPDTAADVDVATATRQMAELNWAIDELERDIEHWRMVAAVPSQTGRTRTPQPPVSVSPTLVLLDHENGYTGYVTAAGPHVAAAEVKLRYQSDLVTVERLPISTGGVANFRVRLAPGAPSLEQARIERLEVRAPGLRPVEVKVSVEPFTRDEAPAATPPDPRRLALIEAVAAAGILVCAVAGLLFAV